MDEDTKEFLHFCGISAGICALTGFGLSFTALSPLIIGGIVGCAPLAALTTFAVGYACRS